jgi:isoamylase
MLTRLQLPINCPDSKEIKLVLIDANGNKTYYALNNKHIGIKYAFIPHIQAGQR